MKEHYLKWDGGGSVFWPPSVDCEHMEPRWLWATS